MTFTPSRKRRSSQFAQIPNALLRDAELSARARGVLCYMLSHADGFEITRGLLASAFTEGRDALDTALGELRDAGYVRSIRHQGENGQFIGRGYLVFDERGAAEADAEDDGKPSPGDPVRRETRTTGNQPAYKNTNSNKNTNVQEHHSQEAIVHAFDRFWTLYPKRAGKGQARAAYIKAVKKLGGGVDALEILDAAAIRYADACKAAQTESTFIAHPATWLNGERWTDEALPQAPRQQQTAAEAMAAEFWASQAPPEDEDGGQHAIGR